jgi:hypothetical protein
MKVKYALNGNESDYNKNDALQKVLKELGAQKVTISGMSVIVDSSYDSKVGDILNNARVAYNRSSV